jgi:phage terminase large subunit-like protein
MVPDHAGSLAGLVGDMAKKVLHIDLMPWQLHALEGMLAVDADNKFVHRSSLVSVARQNGKTTIIQALILFWLVEMPKIRGGKQTVVSGAHRLDLACLLFDDLSPILEEYYGAKIVKSYGRYQATMPDGSKWWVKALKPNQGHGMSIDLVIVDELFDVNPDSVEGGLLPAQRARKNPLACFFSTAGTEESVLFQRWREAGIRAIDKGEPSTMYMAEWSPDPSLDPLHPASWAWGNPALGHTLDMDTIRQESTNPDRASFLRASLNLWVSVVRGWIEPGRWPSLEYTGDIPNGGVVAIESSLDDSRYSATRCVNLPDGRVLVTVAFIAESITELWDNVQELAKDPTIRFALSPTVDATCPPNIERRRVVVGYAELGRFTPLAKNMIAEARLLHTGEKLLAEHVQRAVAVRTDNTIVLSSKRSPGPIELARTMVWGIGMCARPVTSGKPMLVAVNQ